MSNYNITFSPTGGTKRCADILASGIGGNWTDIELCVKESDLTIPMLNSEDVCILAVPSFGGRVPELNAERLGRISGNGAKAVLMCVYGNRAYEDTLIELKDMAEKAGFRCFAGVAAVAEHSIARQFAKGRPDNDDTQVLKGYALKIKEKIEEDDCKLYAQISGNTTYKERSKSKSVPETKDSCEGCASCAKACPVGAIDCENPKITNDNICISCMKCTAVCPVSARKLDENLLNAVSERLAKVCSERKENELFI